MGNTSKESQSHMKKIGIVIIILLVVVGLWWVNRDGEQTNFNLEPVDKGISWELSPVSGYTSEELEKRITDAEAVFASSTEARDKYNALITASRFTQYKGDGEGAFKYLNRAIGVSPERDIAYLNLGVLLNELGATTSARRAYEIAREKAPENARAHLQLLDFYTHTEGITSEDIDEAFQEALSVLAVSNQENVLKEYALWLEGEGKNTEAITVWEQVLLHFPQNKEAVERKIESLR